MAPCLDERAVHVHTIRPRSQLNRKAHKYACHQYHYRANKSQQHSQNTQVPVIIVHHPGHLSHRFKVTPIPKPPPIFPLPQNSNHLRTPPRPDHPKINPDNASPSTPPPNQTSLQAPFLNTFPFPCVFPIRPSILISSISPPPAPGKNNPAPFPPDR